MLNEKINYKVLRVDLDLKNVAILCEVDRVRTRLRYKKALWDTSPLRPPNFTLTVDRNYSNVTTYNTFHNSLTI